MKSPLRILHLEDDSRDAELIRAILEAEGIVSDVTRVETEADFVAAFEQGGFDLILADYTLPSFDGLSALKMALEKRPDVPFIFVSGTLGEEAAIEALKIGATDYILKQRLSRIVPSVHRALRETKERAERKRAEDALRRSEAYLSEAQRLSHTGSFGWDVGSGKIYWSQETFRIYEYNQTTQPTIELVEQHTHPEDRELLRQVIDRVSRERKDFDFEHRLLMPNGSVKYVHVVGHPAAEDESGNFECVGAVTDITDHKHADQALQRSQFYLSEGQRLAHMGSWAFNPAGFDYWSSELFEIHGLDPSGKAPSLEEYLGLVHPEDREFVVQAVQKMLAEHSRFDFTKRIVRPDGKIRRVRCVGIPATYAGIFQGFVGTGIDVTEQERADAFLAGEKRILEILAQAATLEEAAPKILQVICECLDWDVGALWRTDREAGVLRCLELWHKESLDVSEFEATSRARTIPQEAGLPGRVWSRREFAYIPDVVHDPSFFRAAIAAREGLHAAFAFPILLGTEVLGVVELFSREIRQPDKELFNMITTIGSQIGQFIERKRGEEALEKAQMELTHVARVATLGEMTASIAHELNQPLGAVVNSASACLRWLDAQKLEEARQSVARVIAEGHRASEIIGRIRALAKKAPTRKDWLDVNETIHEVIALVQSGVQRSGVALGTQLSDQVPLILADRIQLQQVILNLMMNAIEAMSGTGEGSRELWVRSGSDESQGVMVSVQDSGPGLDPKSFDHLFDAFYTTKPQGLGMGLAISRSLIEAHGGRLWASANAPHGAVFQFTLPIGTESQA